MPDHYNDPKVPEVKAPAPPETTKTETSGLPSLSKNLPTTFTTVQGSPVPPGPLTPDAQNLARLGLPQDIFLGLGERYQKDIGSNLRYDDKLIQTYMRNIETRGGDRPYLQYYVGGVPITLTREEWDSLDINQKIWLQGENQASAIEKEIADTTQAELDWANRIIREGGSNAEYERARSILQKEQEPVDSGTDNPPKTNTGYEVPFSLVDNLVPRNLADYEKGMLQRIELQSRLAETYKGQFLVDENGMIIIPAEATAEDARLIGVLNGTRDMYRTITSELIASQYNSQAALALENHRQAFDERMSRLDRQWQEEQRGLDRALRSAEFEESMRHSRVMEALDKERIVMQQKNMQLDFFTTIAANPSMLFFMNQMGFIPHMENILGVDLSGFRINGPVNPLSQINIQQLQAMPAEQRKLTIFALQAQTGLTQQELIQELNNNAPGSSTGIRRGTFANA